MVQQLGKGGMGTAYCVRRNDGSGSGGFLALKKVACRNVAEGNAALGEAKTLQVIFTYVHTHSLTHPHTHTNTHTHTHTHNTHTHTGQDVAGYIGMYGHTHTHTHTHLCTHILRQGLSHKDVVLARSRARARAPSLCLYNYICICCVCECACVYS